MRKVEQPVLNVESSRDAEQKHTASFVNSAVATSACTAPRSAPPSLLSSSNPSVPASSVCPYAAAFSHLARFAESLRQMYTQSAVVPLSRLLALRAAKTQWGKGACNTLNVGQEPALARALAPAERRLDHSLEAKTAMCTHAAGLGLRVARPTA